MYLYFTKIVLYSVIYINYNNIIGFYFDQFCFQNICKLFIFLCFYPEKCVSIQINNYLIKKMSRYVSNNITIL